MGQIYNSDVSSDTTLVTTAETVIATVSGVSCSRPGQSINLRGNATVTIGTAGTGLTFRWRRDSLTGPLVGEAVTVQITTAAASTEDHEHIQTDLAPGELAGATYVLTVAQVAATGNGTVVHASGRADVYP